MATKFEAEEGLTGINVTPLVDIMLVLLIIFMVTTTYIVAPSIEIELPEASSGAPTEISMLGLMLSANGILLLNGDETTEDGLRAFIRSAESGDPEELQAIIAADRECRHGDVVHLIDLIKQEGVIQFAINIEFPPETRAEESAGTSNADEATGGTAG
ncbi:MAG: biopolymer transporter ExbD [Myxococcota bacterium]|jgi:biopolymer transport protein ExbD|nr:biopolymer transporter ExbD [Myxococcota bacterium]